MARHDAKLTSARKARAVAALPEEHRARGATRAHDVAKKRTPRSMKQRADEPKKAAKPKRRARARAAIEGPVAGSVAIVEASPITGPPNSGAAAAGRVMELHWGDEPAPRPEPARDALIARWATRGDTLLRHLAEHGAARHEYRADLREGRFIWVAPDGRVSAEAEARAICRYVPTTEELVMAWVDPMMRGTGVARIDGTPAERDDVDEESAWRVAMEAADAARAEYLYRVTTPEAWYFFALSRLTFTPGRASWSPSTPVGLVLRGLGEARRAVESRAEPTEVLRERLAGLGRSLVHEAEYAYRGTDWVSRLSRTGRRLVTIAERLPRSSFKSVAAGTQAEWLDREGTIELASAIGMLEDEWALFG